MTTPAGIPDFTILCACDPTHVEELRISYATWAKHKPSLLQRPMLVICDPHTSPEPDYENWYRQKLWFLVDHPAVAELKFPTWLPDAPLRERMVSAFVYGVKWVRTSHYLKLDSDLVATGQDNWISPEWFSGNPAIIAPPWGYTKPANQLTDFWNWSDQYPVTFPQPMPDFVVNVNKNKAFHRRMISYCQFGDCDWTWRMAEAAVDRLPIASQDGFLSLCAARSGAEIRYVQMKNLGWRHVGSNINRLRAAAAEAMK